MIRIYMLLSLITVSCSVSVLEGDRVVEIRIPLFTDFEIINTKAVPSDDVTVSEWCTYSGFCGIADGRLGYHWHCQGRRYVTFSAEKHTDHVVYHLKTGDKVSPDEERIARIKSLGQTECK